MSVVLACEGIQIRFGGVIAADGVDIAIEDGENLAIIGPNGAGKTTFLNICTGYLKPHQPASVFFDGREVTRLRRTPPGHVGLASPGPFRSPSCFTEHSGARKPADCRGRARDRQLEPVRASRRSIRIPERRAMIALLDLMVKCSRPRSSRPVG